MLGGLSRLRGGWINLDMRSKRTLIELGMGTNLLPAIQATRSDQALIRRTPPMGKWLKTTDCLTFKVEDAIAWITLNRPERRNAPHIADNGCTTSWAGARRDGPATDGAVARIPSPRWLRFNGERVRVRGSHLLRHRD